MSLTNGNGNNEKNSITNYLIIVLFILAMYLSWNILKPFVSGFLLAYLIYPLQKQLVYYTNNKVISALLILILIGVVLIYTSLAFYEFVYGEFLDIIQQMPYNTKKLLSFFDIKINANNGLFDDLNKFSFENILSKITSYLFLIGYKVLKGKYYILLELFSFIFIMPVSTFFFLLNMGNLDNMFGDLLPKNLYINMVKFIDMTNKVFNEFLYGQLLVILYQLIFYYILLTSINFPRINFYLFIIGLGSFIPSFGSLIGILIFAIVSFIENTLSTKGLIVFILGYFYENNVLIPKLVGKTLGISSSFIWCSVTIGGKILGFIGFIFSIPLGAVFYQIYLEKKNESKVIEINK
jgi:predicted PurR-regulated permease PerM